MLRARYSDLILCGAFLVMVSLPLITIGIEKTKGTENRAMTAFPKLQLTRSGIHDFMIGTEQYIADHFGLRGFLIDSYKYISMGWFGQSVSDRMIIGKDGWLFYTDEDIAADIQRTERISAENKQQWAERLTARAQSMNAQHIAYRFIVPPEKSSIYSEFLPDSLPMRPLPSRLDDLLGSLSPEVRNLIVDPRPSLLAAKTAHSLPLYFKTDTHWTSYGAYIGYVTLMRSLSHAPMSIPLASFHVDPVLTQHDLATMGRLDVNEADIIAQTKDIAACVKPGALIDGREDSTLITITSCTSAKGTALIFHDSFTDAMAPYLSASFGRVVYIAQMPTDASIAEWVKKENPDIVIEERVERGMRWVPAKQ